MRTKLIIDSHFPSPHLRSSSQYLHDMAAAQQHPLRATAQAIAGAAGGPRGNEDKFNQGINKGPADIAAEIAGVSSGGKKGDDAEYFTNNEGHPWPDPWVSDSYDAISTYSAADIWRTELIARPLADCRLSATLSSFRSSKPSIVPRTLSVSSDPAPVMT